MKQKGRRISVGAFTIVELVVIIATLFLLAGLLLPGLAKSRGSSQAAIDLSNVRQILKAVGMYAADNSDFCPYPTWGNGGTGAGGWAYGTSPIPGVPTAPTVFGVSGGDANLQLSNQIHYFKTGQLAPFLANNQGVLECPTDMARRAKGADKTRYLQRQVKLTAYTFTGAISGYGAPKEAANAALGGTFKLSDFAPTAFLMWEADESIPFNFGDAASNPENQSESYSQRHFGNSVNTTNKPIMMGTFGLQGSYISSRRYNTLRNTPAENDLRCGPGYR